MIRFCWHKWSNWTAPKAEYEWSAQYRVCEKCGLSQRKRRFFWVIRPDLEAIKDLYDSIFNKKEQADDRE